MTGSVKQHDHEEKNYDKTYQVKWRVGRMDCSRWSTKQCE